MIHRRTNQRGITIVELVVAMVIFSIFSTMFLTTTVQFMRTSQRSEMRTQSASALSTSVITVSHFVQYAKDFDVVDNGTSETLYLLLPGFVTGYAGNLQDIMNSDMCVRLTYIKENWNSESTDGEGTLRWNSQRIVKDSTGTSSFSGYSSADMVITSNILTSNLPGTPSEYSHSLFAKDGSSLIFQPAIGGFIGGKPVATSTKVSISARNFSSSSELSLCEV